MTHQFEERLLTELRSLVSVRPSAPSFHRRRLVPIAATAAVLAIAGGVGIPLLTGGGSAAYAVTKNDDGSVTVEVSSLSDAAGLQQKLRDAGVPAAVQYIPPGEGCKDRTFTPAAPGSAGHGMIGVRAMQRADGTSEATFTISRSMIQPGLTLVIQTATGADRGSGTPASLMVAWAQGDVLPCELVEAAQSAEQPSPGLPPLGAVTGNGPGLQKGFRS